MLALVERGLGSPYRLKSRAGLSVGSTAPVLRRLTDEGYLRVGPPKSRGTRQFTITPAGRKLLRSRAPETVAELSQSVDVIVRQAYIAMLLGNVRAARAALTRGSVALSARAGALQHESAALENGNVALDGTGYSAFRAYCDTASFAAQSRALRKLARLIRVGAA